MNGNSKEVELAYIAGLIDGEGAIFITHDPFHNRKSVHRTEIRIGMIEKVGLDFMVETLKLGKVKEEKPYHHKRPMYRVVFSKRSVVREVINKLLPYLKVKKEQALLALDFLDHVGDKRRSLTDEDCTIRHTFYAKMRVLNGISTPATTERKGKRGRDKSVRLETTV